MSRETRSAGGSPDPSAVPGPADWADLRAFVEVARQSSFSRAGLRLLSSQSTVSRQISRLERRFGVVLFERTSRRVRLTPIGELILAQLSDSVAAVEDILLTSTPRTTRTAVRAMTCHVPQELVLDGLAALSGVEWVLGAGTVDQGLRSVCDGGVDHAVTLWFPQVRPLPVDRLLCRAASVVSLRIALPRDGAGGFASTVRLRDLRGARWALPADDDLESAFRLACVTAGFVPEIRLRVPPGADPALGVRQGLAAVVGPWSSVPREGRVAKSPDLPTTTLMVTSRLGTGGVVADNLAALVTTLHHAA